MSAVLNGGSAGTNSQGSAATASDASTADSTLTVAPECPDASVESALPNSFANAQTLLLGGRQGAQQLAYLLSQSQVSQETPAEQDVSSLPQQQTTVDTQTQSDETLAQLFVATSVAGMAASATGTRREDEDKATASGDLAATASASVPVVVASAPSTTPTVQLPDASTTGTALLAPSMPSADAGAQAASIQVAAAQSTDTQAARSASRKATLGDTPSAAASTEVEASDSGLAFAARLNEDASSAGNAAQPEKSAQSEKAAATPAASDRIAAKGTAAVDPLPDAATGQAAATMPHDAVPAAKASTTVAAVDEKVKAATNADDTSLTHATPASTTSANAARTENSTAPAAPKPTSLEQPATNLGAAKDIDESSASQPLREVTIRIATDTSQSADVRMLERNGEIQVAVRASDPVLASSLRSDVNNLVSSLSVDGISAEVWHPGMSAQAGANTDSRQGQSGDPSSLYQRADQRFQQSGDQGHGREDRQKPAWLDELD